MSRTSSPPALHVEEITIEACLPLRRVVLWPDLTEDACRVPEDPVALHLGAVTGAGHGKRLVGCLSLCPVGANVVQLRKFAVLSEFQKQGIGTALMEAALLRAEASGARSLCLDARIGAIPFYRRFGLNGCGAPFLKGSMEHLRMEIALPRETGPGRGCRLSPASLGEG